MAVVMVVVMVVVVVMMLLLVGLTDGLTRDGGMDGRMMMSEYGDWGLNNELGELLVQMNDECMHAWDE